ncbi:hypothetical protein EC991_004186 [Linnemannia zychae]|nr:hypothetical protein EC991_004186 [Linnemannia zychae]
MGIHKEMLRVGSFRPAKFIERMVQAQSVHCPTAMSMWCHWTGPMKDTEEHLESTTFTFMMNYSVILRSSTLVRIGTWDATIKEERQILGTRQSRPSAGYAHRQGPISPPQSSPPIPMIPHHHPHLRHVAQKAAAHPGYGQGLRHTYQQQTVDQQRASGQPRHQLQFFHTPDLPNSDTPRLPSPPAQPVFERAGSYDMSQDFEQLSIDEIQKALDAELKDDDDLAFYSPNVVAAAAAHMDGMCADGDDEEEIVQVERTDSMDGMEISDMTMSAVMAKPLSPMQEIATQQPTRESTPEHTLEPVQEVNQLPTVQDVSQSVVISARTQESIPTISPIITQQIEEEALLLQCDQQMGQEDSEITTKEIGQVAEQTLPQEEKVSQPELQCTQEIAVSELPTLSPQVRRRLSPSPLPPRGHPAPENVLPPAQRRRIIVDEEESERGSGEFTADADHAEEEELFGKKQRRSSAVVVVAKSMTTHVDQLPRRSITYTRQDPQDKNSRVFRDITDAWAPPQDERPKAQNPRLANAHRPPAERRTSSSTAQPGLVSGMGLTADVFRVLNQHVQQNQSWLPTRTLLSGPAQRSPPRNSATSASRRNLGRFNPLPMRVIPAPAAQTTTDSTSPHVHSSAATSAATSYATTPLASPPASSSDDDTEPENAQLQRHQQQRQQQPLNPELANFLLLTQNPPLHLVAEPEPQSFVPFVAYKPRYLKSRKKKGKAGRTYGQPVVRDKDVHDRYQNLVPPILTPDITSPENSIASQAHLHN